MNKFTRLILNICLFVFQIVPDSVLLVITQTVLKLTGYRKQVINKNFNNTTVNKRHKLEFKTFYQSNIKFIARIIIESLGSISNKQLERITFSDINKLENQCKSSNGLILLASHYGNWELACSMLPRRTDLPVYGVYKPLKNKAADQLMLEKRSKYGLRLIPMKKIGRTILENKSAGVSAIYILIADQNPNSKNSIIWSQFLGVKTAFFNGPTKLYQKYKFNVAYMNVTVGDKLFEYNINIETNIQLGQDGDGLVDAYSKILESQILAAPEYWLWSHKRWKRSF